MIIIESENISDEIYRKDTQSFLLEFLEEIEDPENPKKTIVEPIDITGWEVYYIVKRNLYDPDADALIEKVLTNHFDALKGQTIVELSSDDTDIDDDYYHYIIYIKTPIGEQKLIAQDNLIIKLRGKE